MTSHRFWELDALRGIAIVLMVIFHALFILYFAYDWDITVASGPLRLIGRAASSTFLVLVGTSAYLSYEKARRELTTEQIAKKFIIRGLTIFSCGLVVTIVSYLLVPQSPIMFGVLHFIGVSVMLSLLVMRLSTKWLLAGAALIWLIGQFIRQSSWPFAELLFFGFMPVGFSSLDYFPILPYFALVMVGIALGKTAYTNHQRQFNFSHREHLQIFQYLGRHSLLIYFLHVPVILLGFWLLGL